MFNVQNTNQAYGNKQPSDFFEIHKIPLEHVLRTHFHNWDRSQKHPTTAWGTGPQNIILVLKI